MSRKLHHFLFAIFVLIFAVAAPLLLLYTSGYRYDFKKRKIVKTGNILIDSLPNGATIYLNGEVQKPRFHLSIFPYKEILGWQKLGGTTPAIITNLTPNEYLIEVKRPNYQTWTKKLSVHGGLTTFAKKVLLFLENPRIEKIISGKINLAEPAPDRENLAYTIPGRVKILNLKNLESKTVANLTSPITYLEWSPDSKKILAAVSEDYLILDATKTSYLLSLKKLLGFKPKEVHWAKQNNNLIFVLYENWLYQVDLTSLTFNPVFNFNYFSTGQITDWQIEQNQINYIKLKGNKAYLETNELADYQTKPFSLEIPHSSNYHFLKTKPQQKQIITLLDKENEKLLLIEEEILLNTEAKDAVWRINELFYYNNFELWHAALVKKEGKELSIEKEIINRFSQPLTLAFWHPKGDYIIFSKNSQVLAIELDGRDRRNMAELVTAEEINKVIIDRKGKCLYLAGIIGEEEGLFKVEIQ